ncbi:MAG: DUF177 domain-containing protein [Rhodospirillales bacterium]|nr:DUF177 domain-containing protein [Rhodospirillales bacterium]
MSDLSESDLTGTELENLPTPEFSRLISLESAVDKPLEMHIDAEPEELDALTKRFDIDAVESLGADIRFTAQASGNLYRLDGIISGAVRQTCVVTLEPVEQQINIRFHRDYAPGAFIEQTDEVVIDALADDPPEPVLDGMIDAGEAVAEHFGLEIDPFPRAPGAQFDEHNEDRAEDHPFAALRDLKRDK